MPGRVDLAERCHGPTVGRRAVGVIVCGRIVSLFVELGLTKGLVSPSAVRRVRRALPLRGCGTRLLLRPAHRRGRASSPSSGCQRTPSVKRRDGSSSASIVPSGARAASRRPSPSSPKPWWWCDFTSCRSPRSASSGVSGRYVHVVLGEHARRLACARRCRPDPARAARSRRRAPRSAPASRGRSRARHVALERRPHQLQLEVVALADDAVRLRDALRRRTAPGRGRSRRRRSARRRRPASRRASAPGGTRSGAPPDRSTART